MLVLRRRVYTAVVALALALVGLSCGERATGPAARGQASLGFAFGFSERAALVHRSLSVFGLAIDNVRIRLETADEVVVLDTVVVFPAGQETISIALRVPITGSQQTFLARVELRDGLTVLFSGIQSVVARAGPGGQAAPEIVTEYVGPGATATSVVISPRDTVIAPGVAVAYTAVALDDNESPVPDAPIDWVLSDSSRGTIAANGLFTAGGARGSTRVIARLPSLVADSVLVSIVPPASQIAVISGQAQTGTVGQALPAPIVVETRASDNLPVPGVQVVFALTLGGGTLSADTLVTNSLGRASVTLTLDQTPGPRTVQVSSAGLPAVNVTATGVAGAPTQLVIIQQPPTTVAAGATLATAPIVEARDQFGNPVLVAGYSVSVALTSPAMGTLNGGVAIGTNAAGRSEFPGLSISGPIGNATLTFTGAGVSPVVSTNIAVTLGAPANLVVEGGTNVTVLAGDTLPTIHAVRVTDAGGNGVPGEPILVQRASAPDSTFTTDANGRVRLGELDLPQVVGTYVFTFSSGALNGSPAVVTIDVLPAGASTLAVIQQPASSAVSGAALDPQPQVQILDSLGNAVPMAGVPITAAVLDGNYVLGGTTVVNTTASGLATFTDLTITGAVGPVQLRFSSPGLVNVDSDVITISPAPATHLVFTTPPANGSAGTLFSVVVGVRDAQNAPVPSYDAEVQIQLGNNPAGAALSGVLAVDAVNGVATFNNLSIDSVGTGYTLIATSGGLTAAISDGFNMVAGAGTPMKLAFTTQPINVPEDMPFSVEVTALDAFDDPAVGFSGPITVSIANNPASGLLGGVVSVNAIAGVATFTGLSISEAGVGYTLRAATPGLTPDTSNAFEVTFSGITHHDQRRPGDIAIYKNYNAWALEEKKEEAVLRATPFKLAPGLGDYSVHPLGELAGGIPATTSLLIITSASNGNANNQITDQNAGAAALDAWVRSGGWLVVHAGDNAFGQAYSIPGMLAAVDDSLTCTGTALSVTDHALIRGPDALLGTSDDLVNGSLSLVGFCHDNHGALNGKLPGNAQVLMQEAGVGARPTYATYTLGAGRVIVTTLSIEYVNHPDRTMINHLYWAINGVNAGPAQPIYRVANWLGGNGDWSDTTKWDIGIAPAVDDTVRIQAPGTYTVILDAPVTTDALIVGGVSGTQTVLTDFATLTVTGQAHIKAGGVLQVDGGTLRGLGQVVVDGALQWTGGTMLDSGITRISSTGSATLTTSAQDLAGGRRFEVAGAVTHGGASMSIANNAQLVIEATGTWTTAGGAGISLGSGGGSILNAGTLAVAGGGIYPVNVALTNNGTVEVSNGELQLQSTATVTHTGQFNIQSAGGITFQGGNHTFNGQVSGAGVFRHATGTHLIAAPMTVGGLLIGTSGAVTMNAALSVADSLLLSPSGTLTLNSGSTIAVPRLLMLGGTLQGTDTVLVTDSLHWTQGTMQGTGVTRTLDTTGVYITGGSTKVLAGSRRFELGGHALWNGGNVTTNSTSPFVVSPTGELEVTGDFTFGGSGSLSVLGRILRSAGGTTVFSAPTTVAGELDVLSGIFQFTSSAAVTHAGRLRSTAPATIDLVAGTHTLNGPVVGTGRVRFNGGAVTLNDSLAVAAVAVSSSTINALGPVAVADSLIVTGGTLNLNAGTNTTVPRVVVTAGTLGGSDTLIVSDSLHWAAGTMTGAGATRVATGARAALVTTSAKTLLAGRRLEIHGTAVWNSGALTLGGGSPIIVGASGELEIHGDLTVGTTTGGGSITNAGLIERLTGAGNAVLTVPITNTGVISVQSGVLRFAATGGPFTHAGAVNVAAGASAEYSTGTVTLASAFAGAGGALFSGATATLSGAYGLQNVSVTGGTLTLATGAQVAVPLFTMTGGTLAGNDTLVVTDSLLWNAGTMSGAGMTRTLDSVSVMLLSAGTRSLLVGRQFRLEGTALFGAGAISLGGGAQLRVAPTGSLSILADVSITATTGGGSVVNEGVFVKSAGTGVSTISTSLINDGAVAALSGTLRFTGAGGPFTHAGDFTVSSPGVLDFNVGTHEFNGLLAGTGSLVFSGATATASSDLSPQSLTVSGGTLTLATGQQLTVPQVTLSSGTLQGSDTLVVSGGMTWSGGTQSGAGLTMIPSGVTLGLTGAGSRTLLAGRQLEVGGTMVAAAGNLSFGGGSSLRIEPTGELDVQGGVPFSVTTGGGSVTNLGLVKRTTAAGTSTFTVPFTNSGTVDVQIGFFVLQPTGTLTHSGAFTVGAPGALTFTTATHNVNGPVTGPGLVNVTAGTASFADSVDVGVFNSTGGSSNFPAGAFLADTLKVSGGTLSFDAGRQHVIPDILMSGGIIQGVDTLVVTDSLSWTSGTMGGTGRTVIVDTAVAALTTTSGKTLSGGRSLELEGTLLWNGGTWTLGGGAPIRVTPGGTFTAAGALSMNGTGSILNAGTFLRATTTGAVNINVPFTNDGDVNVSIGSLVLAAPSGTATHSGPFVVSAPAALEFAGAGTHIVNSTTTGTGTLRLNGTNVTVNDSVNVPIVTALSGTATLAGPVAPLDTLRHTGGTLSISSGAPVPITRLFATSTGALQGSDTLIVLDSMEWTAGTLGGVGATLIPDTAQLVLSTTNGKTLAGGRRLEIAGDARWVAGTITITGASPLTVTPTGDLEISGNLTLSGASGTGPFENHGVLRRTTATGVATINAPFENHGLVQVISGTLTIGSPDTHTHPGAFEVTDPALLTIQGGTHVIDSTIVGTGRLSFGATSATLNGSVAVSAIANSGTTTILGPLAALDSLTLTGGSLLLDRGAQVSTAALSHLGGVLGGMDTLVVSQTLTWNAGTMGGTGRTILNSGGTFSFASGSAKSLVDTRVLELASSGIWTGGTLALGAGTELLVAAGGELDVRFNGSVTGLGTLRNAGRVVKSTTTGTASIASVLANNGTLDVDLGILSLTTASGSMTHSGTFNVATGTQLSFTGAAAHTISSTIGGTGHVNFAGSAVTLDGALTVPSVIYSSGTLTVNGTLSVGDSLRATTSNPLVLNTAVVVPAGGLMGMRGTGGISGTGSLTNQGTFQRLTSGATIPIAVPFDNQGTIAAMAGTLNFTRQFAHQAGAMIQGSATVQVNVDSVTTFGGNISPVGATLATATLTINGGVVQGASSNLNIEIGGLTQTSQYDRLAVSAMTSAFVGILNVTVINGFTPVNGNTVRILTWGSGPAPSFGTVNLPPNWSLVPGATFLDVTYTQP